MLVDLLAQDAAPGDLMAARVQMALSLGWHIVIASFGVGMPAVTVFAEWRGLRTGDPTFTGLARRWAKAMGVLFAVGAVSGTILSFEMGLLWPGLMGRFGDVIGLPFAMEGIAFFVEAIFVGIYLYAWDRVSPRVHLLSGLPVCVAGVASAFFVVSANAWMNQPRGFDLVSGEVTDVRPWEAMFNPATPPQTVHMIVAAFMVTGFGISSVYAVALLRGRRDRYHRLGFAIPFTVAAVLSPVQVVVGDWAAHFVGEYQPTKLAAMEGLARTQAGAPLSLGGVYVDGELRYAVEVPNALSLLAKWDPDAVVMGLDQVPDDQEPPVTVVKWAFQLMVAIGFGLVALSAWWALAWWRRRGPPRSPWFLRAAALSGVAAAVAVEAGWVVTEVGRQPWIVYGVLRTAEAVNPAPGLATGLALVAAVYAVLTVATVAVLWRMARHRDEPIAPQEGVPEPVDSRR
ncbi:cytochrome ubiquinol oxidase subunit I [Micromonospora sp. S4605]|uniref:cytochrome ubiquinol oxidase subunit I n=1 Tax=Micromonospora sp. S4605 TaxID=1420897 RepID=UPI000D6EF07D|nr:cytochrome ubiquinol oxidase subunit I [Micromonospora sp. S4605]PWU47882.1 cytochrome ubiquinol oxidase subunit I [Micromonospora sp. S4605]